MSSTPSRSVASGTQVHPLCWHCRGAVVGCRCLKGWVLLGMQTLHQVSSPQLASTQMIASCLPACNKLLMGPSALLLVVLTVHDGTMPFSSGAVSYKSSTTEGSTMDGLEEATISCGVAAAGSKGT